MQGINRVIVAGHLGGDPETRSLASGKIVANINIATNRRFKDGSGAMRDETEWHRIVLFDRLAEVTRDYLRKGRPVYVEGRLQTREWEDREGKKRTTTEIVADNLQLLGAREADDEVTPSRSALLATTTSSPNGQAIAQEVPF